MRRFPRQRLLLFFLVGAMTVTLLVVLLCCFLIMNKGAVTLPDDVLRKKIVTSYQEEMSVSAPNGKGEKVCNLRVVARILLGRARKRSVYVTAWLVTSGAYDEMGVARCWSEHAQFPEDRRCAVTLLDYASHFQPPLGSPKRGLFLRVSGLPKGAPTAFLYEAFPVTHSRTLTQSFWAGETCLFYVEGDREFVAEPGMTVAEFAAQNNGSFLVLTVKME